MTLNMKTISLTLTVLNIEIIQDIYLKISEPNILPVIIEAKLRWADLILVLCF